MVAHLTVYRIDIPQFNEKTKWLSSLKIKICPETHTVTSEKWTVV